MPPVLPKTQEKKREEERMMGLEPTTFCMASLSACSSVPRSAA
jgi:hypothetical protein